MASECVLTKFSSQMKTSHLERVAVVSWLYENRASAILTVPDSIVELMVNQTFISFFFFNIYLFCERALSMLLDWLCS